MVKDTIYFKVEADSVSEEANLYVVGVEDCSFKFQGNISIRYKIYIGYNITDEIDYYNYFTIGGKGTGIMLDNKRFLISDDVKLDVKSINSYIHNRKVNKILEQL